MTKETLKAMTYTDIYEVIQQLTVDSAKKDAQIDKLKESIDTCITTWNNKYTELKQLADEMAIELNSYKGLQ